jgi:hypothetical protein
MGTKLFWVTLYLDPNKYVRVMFCGMMLRWIIAFLQAYGYDKQNDFINILRCK